MYIVKNEDGRLWGSYEDLEEAQDVCNELNSQLDILDNQWCVYEN